MKDRTICWCFRWFLRVLSNSKNTFGQTISLKTGQSIGGFSGLVRCKTDWGHFRILTNHERTRKRMFVYSYTTNLCHSLDFLLLDEIIIIIYYNVHKD